MGVLKNLFDGFRDAFGPSAAAFGQAARLDGSAASPPPPVLHVPEDLKRAVDNENRRKAPDEDGIST